MKPSHFSQEQIIKILEEDEAGNEPFADLARRHGITPWAFYQCLPLI